MFVFLNIVCTILDILKMFTEYMVQSLCIALFYLNYKIHFVEKSLRSDLVNNLLNYSFSDKREVVQLTGTGLATFTIH